MLFRTRLVNIGVHTQSEVIDGSVAVEYIQINRASNNDFQRSSHEKTYSLKILLDVVGISD